MNVLDATRIIWPLLVETAKQREVITYSDLAARVGTAPRSLGRMLGIIQDYCRDNNLPPLTAIVVQKMSGKPGPGFNARPRGREAQSNEEVWSYIWPDNNPFRVGSTPYWVFICNPRKWPIDVFLERGIKHDTWDVRDYDAPNFAPGQLAIVRVGVDRRNKEQLGGRERLKPGIYAVCQVESLPYRSQNPNRWDDGSERRSGWTVKIRYLQTFENRPLTIGHLRQEAPEIAPKLIDGFQASSFPISERDFRTVINCLDLDFDEIGNVEIPENMGRDDLDKLVKNLSNAAPSVKERFSRYVERGKIGGEVKRFANYMCQLCTALGSPAKGFSKSDGTPYVEAHHIIPVSTLGIGVLSHANVISVCANHHRQLHYGRVDVNDLGDFFEFVIDGRSIKLRKNQPMRAP